MESDPQVIELLNEILTVVKMQFGFMVAAWIIYLFIRKR